MTEILNSMGVPKPKFRASFSQWENYQTCPQKWKFASIMKLPRTPPGPAAARGLHMHDRAEKFIKGEIDDVNNWEEGLMFGDKKPAVIHPKYIPMLRQFRDQPNGERYTEKKMAFDSEWYLCPTSSEHAAFIAVLDAARIGGDRYVRDHPDNGKVFIGEWKSGKPKDTHVDQRKIYAMFGYKTWLYPHVEVTTYYLEDTAPPQRLVLKSEEGFERLKALWKGRVEEMESNSICAPRPGFYCRWCDFAKNKGGPCQFGAN